MKYLILAIGFILVLNATAQRYSVVREKAYFILFEILDSNAIPMDTLWNPMIKNYCFDMEQLRTTTIIENAILLQSFDVSKGSFQKSEHAMLEQRLLKKYKINQVVSMSYGFYIDRKRGEGYVIPYYKEEYLVD